MSRDRDHDEILARGGITAGADSTIEMENADALVVRIQQVAPALLARGGNQQVEEWLNRLPPARVEQDPWLLYWRGSACMARGFAVARVSFEPALQLFEARGDAAGSYLAWSGIVDSIVCEWADFARLDVWIDELARLQKRYPDFPSPEIEGRVAGSIFGALMFHLPRHPDIGGWAERILTLVRFGDDPAYRILIGNSLVLYHLWWSGNHAQLGVVMDLLRPPADGADLPPLPRIIWISLKGLHQWAAGYSAEAQKTFLQGVRVADESDVHVWDFMLYFQGIVSFLSEGDHRNAGRYIDELFTRIDRAQQLNLTHCCYVAAWQAVLAHKIDRAQAHVEMAMSASKDLGGPFSRAAVWAAWAQVQYLRGREAEALDSLETALQLAREINAPLIVFRNLMVKATFALAAGDEAACLTTLREALALGRQGHYMNYSWWDGPMVTRLVVKALEAGIEVEYVRALIVRRQLLPEEPPPHLAHWPWPLRIQTFGAFVIQRDDMPLALGNKQNKPLELLKALIALGGKEAHEGQIADLLWPDGDGDANRSVLDTTVYRLRLLLGNKEAIALRDGRLTIDRRLVYCDVWAFKQLLREARLKVEGGDISGALHLHAQAQALYHGPFLGDEHHPWLLPLRENLAGRFVASLQFLAEQAIAAGDFPRAEHWYQHGLEIDGLNEHLYQGLMRCQLATGQHAAASTTFLRCKKNLSRVLGVAPSATTVALLQMIDGKEEQG